MEIEHNRKIAPSGSSTLGRRSDPELERYQELAAAIILQAVKDYRRLRRDRDGKKTGREIREIERFFLSDFFAILTNLDGKLLLMKLKAEKD